MPKGKRPPNAKKGEFTSTTGRAAQKKSVEAKAKNKTLRKCLEELLEKEYTNDLGEAASGAMIISTKLFKRAASGDVQAFLALRDTVGQKPVEKVVTSEVDPDVIAEVERMVNDE